MKYIIKNTLWIMVVVMIWSCSGFLDERPNKGILIPTTQQDIRALLDNDSDLNVVPSFGLLSSDDLVITDAGWASLPTQDEQNAYLWNEEIWPVTGSADWARMYRIIFISNVVLEQADKLPPSSELSRLKSEALFHRAHAHFMLAQLFSPVYSQGNNDQELGIPLRLNSEILERSPRVPLQTYYSSVISDLDEAFVNLPYFETIKTRPSKLAAQALLARVYLTIGNYSLAEEASDWVLSRPEVSLLNYNALNPSINYPFIKYNSEVIFHTVLISQSYNGMGNINVWMNPKIIESYQKGDLRKDLFTLRRNNGGFSFKGQYTGNFSRFGGLALDEVYYIRAECLARKNDNTGAITLLNQILKSRYKDSEFMPIEELDNETILQTIIEEKRKSLVYRGINWIDLRRLNLETRFQRTLERQLNGETYRLNPISKKYVLPIPENELSLNPISQTDRRD